MNANNVLNTERVQPRRYPKKISFTIKNKSDIITLWLNQKRKTISKLLMNNL